MSVGGDINASEVLVQRDLLNRLGYGIFDLEWGTSGYGFENVKNFSYVVEPDIDPKIYRHKVFEMTGHYYEIQLAREMWYEFLRHKLAMSQAAGRDVDLKTAAQDWFNRHSHAFLKDWAFHQATAPLRFRSRSEPRKNKSAIVIGGLFPGLRELLDAGFEVRDIIGAAWKARKPYRGGMFYMRLVAGLTGHLFTTTEEAQRCWQEILEHRQYLEKKAGQAVDLRRAILDYYRRLSLLEEIERGEEGWQ